MEYIYKNFDEAVNDLGWFTIPTKEDADSIYKPLNGTIELVTEKKTIIVFDNENWNETYLLDLVSQVLKKQNYKQGQYDLIYCNDKNIRYYMIHGFESKEPIDEKLLNCSVMCINPEINDVDSRIYNCTETLSTLNINDIEHILKVFDTEYMNNQINKDNK